MKSVLISIQPKWCELIASGKKTIEVRKTAPKLEMPFKCYIYCTKGTFDITLCPDLNTQSVKVADKGRGKVIGEFVCDRIDINYPILIPNTDIALYNDEWVYGSKAENTCLTLKEISEYGKGKPVYGWHISDLKIYNNPKELGEFKSFLSDRDIRCKYISKPYNPYGKQVVHCTLQKCYCEFHNLASQTDCCGYEPLKEIRPLTRPFQSWGYVEEL